MAKSILFVTATRIGDAVLSMGILGRLVRDNPGARVTVACGRAAAPRWRRSPWTTLWPNAVWAGST
ncbi:MAG: hypothetical protein RLO05_11735 [Rhodospirillales bacterium]